MIGFYGATDTNIQLNLPKYSKTNVNIDKYFTEKLQIFRLKNNIFFPHNQPITNNNNIGIMADGYIIIRDNISDSQENGKQTLLQLLNLYHETENRFLNNIKTGMFNLIIIEKSKIKIINDWLGAFSLYYTHLKDGNIIFSNNSDFISKYSNQVDWIAITEFLKYGCILGNKTPWKNIKKLQPGSILTFDFLNKEINVENYHNFKPYQSMENISIKKCEEKLTKLLNKASKRLYSPTNKYCMGITGGIDSRLLMASWPNKSDLQSFTGFYTGNEEDVKITEKLIKKLKIPHHTFIKRQYMNSNELHKHLNSIDPIEGKNNKFTKSLPEKAIGNAKIHLTGVYGEILGGEYYWCFGDIIEKIKNLYFPVQTKKIDFKYIAKSLNTSLSSVSYNNLNNCLNENIFSKLVHDYVLEEHIISIINRYNDMNYTLYQVIEIFNLFNRGSYWFGGRSFDRLNREIISPYADYDLINYVLSCPIEIRKNRKLMLSLIKNYYKKWGKTETTFSIIPPNFPYFLQKNYSLLHLFAKKKIILKKNDIDKNMLSDIINDINKSNLIQHCPTANYNLLEKLFLFSVWYEKYIEEHVEDS
jgi:hypothetical protein